MLYINRWKNSSIEVGKIESTGIFDGLQISQFIKNPAFVNSMNEAEGKAWTSFSTVVKYFLDKSKA